MDEAERRGPGVLVLYSTTPGIFVAGTDVADLARRTGDDGLAGLNVRLFDRISRFRWPTIAVVDGPAFGGGCELALACDLRVASPRARFAQPEPALGLIAGAGGNWRLPDLVGLSLARRMLLVGTVLDADEAHSAGLVDLLADVGELESATGSLVERMAARSWRALELTKLALATSRRETTTFDLAAQALLFESPDSRQRLHAFINRTDRREPPGGSAGTGLS